MLHRQLRCLKSIHRYEPPKHIPISKHVHQLVKIGLLLELYQFLVPNFLMQIRLNPEIVLSRLQIIHKASILFNLHQHIYKLADAKHRHE